MDIAICYTVISPENKMILAAAEKRGVALGRIQDASAVLSTDGKGEAPSILIQRSVSFSRSLYLSYYFEKMGSIVLNSHNSARICGDKALCSLELSRAGVPTPKTQITFSPEATAESAGQLGFPLVMKPVMGSWARMVSRLNDSDALAMAVESKEEMGNPWQKIYYLQEHINKPGRDIRAFVVGDRVVAAMYRNSTGETGWKTNATNGAVCTPCPLTSELTELALKAAGAVGEGIYGVDLMESERGLLVHEINHTPEFRGLSSATGTDIAGAIVDYAIGKARL